MHIVRCRIVLSLILLATVSVPIAIAQPRKIGQAICSYASGNISGCASASQSEHVAMASSSRVISIWGGARETIALKSDGTVWTWGLNSCGGLGSGNCGKLGDGTEISRTIPIQVHGPGNVGYLTSVTAIMGGEHANYALKSDGTVWA
jgi:alpha-tubulin suppressor-like RCC1 family protein